MFYLAGSIHDQNAFALTVWHPREERQGRDAGAGQMGTRFDVAHFDVAVLRHDVHQAVIGADLSQPKRPGKGEMIIDWITGHPT